MDQPRAFDTFANGEEEGCSGILAYSACNDVIDHGYDANRDHVQAWCDIQACAVRTRACYGVRLWRKTKDRSKKFACNIYKR